MIIDQAISSFSSFVLIVMVGRRLGPSDLGAFSLVFAAWLIVFGVNRALVVDPMLVRGEREVRSGAYLTAALLVALASSAVMAVIGILMGASSASGRTVLVLAVFLPSLVIQEMWRRVGFLRERPKASALNDGVCLIVQLVAVAVVLDAGFFSSASAMACWAIGATAGAVLGFVQFSVGFASLREGRRMLLSSRGLSSWLALDFFANRWSRQASLYVIAAVIHPAAVGVIQASANLMGPTNILNFGASAAALSDGGNRMRSDSSSAMRRVVWVNAALLAVVVGMYVLIFAIFAKEILGAVYGARYSNSHAVGVWVAIGTLFLSLDTVPMVRMRIMRNTRRLFVVRFALVPFALGATWFSPRDLESPVRPLASRWSLGC